MSTLNARGYSARLNKEPPTIFQVSLHKVEDITARHREQSFCERLIVAVGGRGWPFSATVYTLDILMFV